MKRSTTLASTFVGCFVALAPSALAQDMIGIEWGGTVYRIDGATYVATALGTTGYPGQNGLARATDGTYWTYSSSNLLTIDPATGLGTLVGASNIGDVRGLAFDDADTLFALVNTSSSDLLYTVDLTTAFATYVGDTGHTSLQSLAFANGLLYTHDNITFGGDRGLHVLDPTTAAATDVDPTFGACASDTQALWADASGALYGGRWDLMSIDATTGACTQFGPTIGLDLRGVEFEGATGLASTVDAISVSAGGSQVLDVAVGASHSGAFYMVLGSLSGEVPGTAYAGWVVPLNVDAYTVFTIVNPNTPPLSTSAGTLDGQGAATTTFSLASGTDPGLVGLTARHAAVVLAPGAFLALAKVSNAVPCRLDP